MTIPCFTVRDYANINNTICVYIPLNHEKKHVQRSNSLHILREKPRSLGSVFDISTDSNCERTGGTYTCVFSLDVAEVLCTKQAHY